MAMGAVTATTVFVDNLGWNRRAHPLGDHEKDPRREAQAVAIDPTELAAGSPLWQAERPAVIV